MASDESQEQNRGHPKGTRKRDFSLCFIDGLVPPQELGVGAAEKKGRVVLRSDVVKDDAHTLYLRTRGSTASQVTADRVLDVTARLLG